MKNIADIIAENTRRNAVLAEASVYDPERGIGCCGHRVEAEFCGMTALLPQSMLDDPEYSPLLPAVRKRHIRIRHDFEYWAVKCVTIHDKMSGDDIPFRLNVPQRRLVAELEDMRRRSRPIRVIILKARQWGGSTLVQVYMAWIQMVLKRNWHSFICAHVKDTAATIRGMYSRLLDNYPAELWEGDEPPRFRSFERSQNTREIAGRGCCVTLGSSENQDSSRGSDIAMAHLSEVAFWKDSRLRSPDELVRAAVSGIALAPLTFIAMESTANGVGTYFHNEWLRAEAGKSDKRAVFVPWHEIEIYRLDVDDPAALWESMDAYERSLWESGLTLEMINWYHCKRAEMPTHQRMMSEYPTTPVEAFANTGTGVFAATVTDRLRLGCREPLAVGEIVGDALTGVPAMESTRFVDDPDGGLKVWEWPRRGNRYTVAVDVGGRSEGSDWSVVAVLANGDGGDPPRVVAQWRGHIDHDLLAWKAAAIATYYNRALLVVESNTLESETSPGEPSVVLDSLGREYCNLYMRPASVDATGVGSGMLRPGFHTNVRTKAAIVGALIASVRDGGYVERDNEAVNELVTYEQLPSGAYAARRGKHDDILMTRAIGLYVIASEEPPVDTGPLPSLMDVW